MTYMNIKLKSTHLKKNWKEKKNQIISVGVHIKHLKLNSHEDCSFVDEKLHSRKVPKHHVDDEEEKRSTPEVKKDRKICWVFLSSQPLFYLNTIKYFNLSLYYFVSDVSNFKINNLRFNHLVLRKVYIYIIKKLYCVLKLA